MKPVRLLKKLGAALAVGFIALGLIAGTASAASADGVSGEISRVAAPADEHEDTNGGVSGEISDAVTLSGGVSGEIS
ncbi:hypothetical protein LO763_18420 [Glycomyces sp. A-F 0318]|uniref:hypothetical protein n=1 Tax=Glycomyces amatae TaxID=2881355 RepID=UPI001E481179|nr:hypothetical protein [Glycomyces amatae]MCD0445585.1 hypothetical protein [Glycomyces amatae]